MALPSHSPLGEGVRVRALFLTITIIGLVTLACNISFSGQAPVTAVPRPAVIFLAPDANSQIAEGAPVQIAVDVVDELGAGVVRVDFSIDGVPLGSQQAPNPAGQPQFTALQIWTATGVQGHLIDATAYRKDNTVVGDASLTVTVAPLRLSPSPTLSPTITNTPTDLPTFTPSVTIITVAAFGSTDTPTAAASGTAGTPNPAPSPAPTINGPQASILSATLNVRSGPGTSYALVGVLKVGDIVAIVGRNADRSWWVIQNGPLRGWIINSPTYLTVSGDTSAVPLVAAPPSPVPAAVTPTALPALVPTSTHAP